MRRLAGLGVGLLFVLAVGYGWLNRGQSLAFTTLEHHYDSEWNVLEPGLMVVTNAEEARTLIGWVPDEVQARVAAVDFERYVVVAVFQGGLPVIRSKPDITVSDVSQRGSQIFLQAVVPAPENMDGADTPSSPYHLLRIEKAGIGTGRPFRFTLSVNGRVVQRVTQVVP